MAVKVYNRKIRDIEEELLRPWTYIIQSRSNLLFINDIPDSFQYWLKIPDDKLRPIKIIIEKYLGCSFLSDDIQDNSLYRRKIPSAHCVFGIPLAINATMHIFGLILEDIIKLGHPKAISTFVSVFMNITRGQGTDIYWQENLICVSEEEYKKMTEKKTSSMFMMPVLLMQLFSDNKTDYSKLLNLLGVYYEIRDDYCNLIKQEELEGHSQEEELRVLNETTFCEDLTDGKFSFPVIHALNSPEANTIIYMLKQRTRDPGMKRYFLSVLERLGSLQYTREAILEHDRELRAELARLGGNPYLEAILDDLKKCTE